MDRKNSNRAIMASILGAISLLSLAATIFLSYRNKGDARPGQGVGVLLAMIYSMTGLVLGLVTVQNKEYNRFFPLLGILLNLAALAGIGLILYAGSNPG